jgi:hypothetical protein
MYPKLFGMMPFGAHIYEEHEAISNIQETIRKVYRYML